MEDYERARDQGLRIRGTGTGRNMVYKHPPQPNTYRYGK